MLPTKKFGHFLSIPLISVLMHYKLVQKCKVILVNALYGLDQVLINLDYAMNIIIAIQTKWCKKVF